MVVMGCILTHTSLRSLPSDHGKVRSAPGRHVCARFAEPFGAPHGHAGPYCPPDRTGASMGCIMHGVCAAKPQGPSCRLLCAPTRPERARPARAPDGREFRIARKCRRTMLRDSCTALLPLCAR